MDSLRALPGFRFNPTEEELVGYYLRRKLTGHLSAVESEVIPEADLLMGEPWDLMGLNSKGGGGNELFAFWIRGLKYAQGERANRCTVRGYWKSTGSDRAVLSGAQKIGIKKTLVFYLGRTPRGTKTEWVMHEFRLNEPEVRAGNGGIVVCRVFRKGPSKSLHSKALEARRLLQGLEEAVPEEPSCSIAGPTTSAASGIAPQHRPQALMMPKDEPSFPNAPYLTCTSSPKQQNSCSSTKLAEFGEVCSANQTQRGGDQCSGEHSQRKTLCWQAIAEGAGTSGAVEPQRKEETECADVMHGVAAHGFQEQWELDLDDMCLGGSISMAQALGHGDGALSGPLGPSLGPLVALTGPLRDTELACVTLKPCTQ